MHGTSRKVVQDGSIRNYNMTNSTFEYLTLNYSKILMTRSYQSECRNGHFTNQSEFNQLHILSDPLKALSNFIFK